MNEEQEQLIELDGIYCANCRYCVLLRKENESNKKEYYLRVRCIKEQWRKKLGEEKMYKYFTVARRTVEKCDSYKDMGDLEMFLGILRRSLPVRDEVYPIKK